MGILQLLAKENYIAYSKPLAKIIGVDEAILFGALCSISNLHGYEFFCQQDRLCCETCLTEYRLRNATKSLQKSGLLRIEKRGLPAKNYYCLDETKLVELLDLQSTSSIKFDTTRDTNIDTTGSANIDSTNKKTNIKNIVSKNKEYKKESKQKSFDEIIHNYTEDETTLDLLKEWLKVRKAKRAAMTDRAIQLNISKLDNLAKASDMTVNEYLEEVIARGWAAFYEIKSYAPKKEQSKKSDYCINENDISLDDLF